MVFASDVSDTLSVSNMVVAAVAVVCGGTRDFFFAYPVREKKSRVPPQLGGSFFRAAEGLREFRVPGTRFVFLFGGGTR